MPSGAHAPAEKTKMAAPTPRRSGLRPQQSSSTQPQRSNSSNSSRKNKVDVWICEECEKSFNNEDDKLMICDRCSGKYCIECIPNMSVDDYKVISKSLIACHWYCAHCERDALTAVKVDQEIEERCKYHFSKLNDRIVGIENDIKTKADQKVVESVDANVKLNAQKIVGLAEDFSKLNRKLELSLNEPEEIQRRKGNIIAKGLSETDTPDLTKLTEIFQCLKLDISKVKSHHRVGKVEANNLPNATANIEPLRSRHRPLRVLLEDEDYKWRVVKSAPSIKKVDNAVNFVPHEVFITPDYTILQREKDAQVRSELKKKRAAQPNEGWKIGANFRLVKKPKSLGPMAPDSEVE